MPKHILLVIAVFLIVSVKAIDTLTVRQVYSYNVGDTLDYEVWNYVIIDDGSNEQIYFERKIVTSKIFSTSNDTIFITFNSDTAPDLVISNLDSPAIFYASNNILGNINGCSVQITSDTTTYPGILSNSINASCFENAISYRFTRGLGETYYYSEGGDPIGNQGYYSETLIYYSNGQLRIGTPLEDADGSNISYIPLPEECATWTRTVTYLGGPPGWGSPPFTAIEQIQTGTKYRYNGFNYVEMLYSDGTTTDSLIGYFYNDSVARKAYFAQEIDSPVQVLCDFSMLIGSTCNGSGVILIDTVPIGNQQRAEWYCSLFVDDLMNSNIVAGVGPLYGLMKVKHYWGYTNIDDYPTLVEIDGNLTCFSVCGQTLYPDDTAANCPVLTDVQQINLNNTALKIYPSVNDGKFTVSWTAAHTDDNLQIFDLTGRLIQQYEINSALTTCQMNELSKGMYIWQAVTHNIPIQQGKFIIQ